MSEISVKPQEIFVSLKVYKVIFLHFPSIQTHFFSQLKFTQILCSSQSLKILMEATEQAQLHRRGRIIFVFSHFMGQ